MANLQRSAAQILNSFIDTVQKDDAHGVVSVTGGWRRVAGIQLAEHSAVVDLRGTTLVVAVDHPAWLHKIHAESTKILKAVGHEFPSLGVTQLQLTLARHGMVPASGGPDATPTTRETRPRHRPPDPDGRKAFDDSLQALGDAIRARTSTDRPSGDGA